MQDQDNAMSENNRSSDNTLELKLLDNGIDFILKGIDELFDENHVLRGYSTAVDVSESSYKYGVIHLFSGFLLLLKERLYRHLPELIFKGRVDDVKKKLDDRKIPNTVDLDEALERLTIGPRVTFSEDDMKVIRSVQDIRNKFEHYEVSINKYLLFEKTSKFLELVDRFLINELSINLEHVAEGKKLREKIRTIDSAWARFDNHRRKSLFEEDEDSWSDKYSSIDDFLAKNFEELDLEVALRNFSKIKDRGEALIVGKKILDRIDSIIDSFIIYDIKSNGLSQPDLDSMVAIEIDFINVVGERFHGLSFAYNWLLSYAMYGNDRLQEFSVAAILNLDEYWSDHPTIIDDLIKVALTNPFDSMNDSDDSLEIIDYLDSPRQASMKILAKRYPTDPKVSSLIEDRSINDEDEYVRKWAEKWLSSVTHS
jgi:hypothetical protein